VKEVRDNPRLHRYEIVEDGEVLGFAQYNLRGGRIIVVHTEIQDPEQHRGLGRELVAAMLDDIRVRGLPVVPVCPFVEHYIETHPGYDDLVDHEAFAALNRSRPDQG